MNAAQDELIRFPCRCGVFLTARAAQAGRKGKCGRCGQINVIPAVDEIDAGVEPPSETIAVQEICSVCQSAIEADDERVACGECDLPFHSECWEENLGCSAYGCANVNALKHGPDIRIPSAADDPLQTRRAWRPPRPAPRPATAHEEEEFPWAFLLMGLSGIAALLSVVTCGFPSLLVGALAIAYTVMKQGNVRMDATAACVVLAGLGALSGFFLSLLFWLV